MSHLTPFTLQDLKVRCRKPDDGDLGELSLSLEITSQRVVAELPRSTHHEVIAELRCVNTVDGVSAAGPPLRVLPEPGTAGLLAGAVMLSLLTRKRR